MIKHHHLLEYQRRGGVLALVEGPNVTEKALLQELCTQLHSPSEQTHFFGHLRGKHPCKFGIWGAAAAAAGFGTAAAATTSAAAATAAAAAAAAAVVVVAVVVVITATALMQLGLRLLLLREARTSHCCNIIALCSTGVPLEASFAAAVGLGK